MLVLSGATGKAQKWRRHDWQGSGGLVSHVDLWTQLLDAIEDAGSTLHWIHVPSHIRVTGNDKGDLLVDMGC
jgi:ribonuclease HI